MGNETFYGDGLISFFLPIFVFEVASEVFLFQTVGYVIVT